MRVLSGVDQDRMVANGWRLKIKPNLTVDDVTFESQLRVHFKQVKLYRVTTSVRGYHKTIAMVK